jgi:hypothetical protein
MSRQLLLEAREQAERSEAAVRAAALLHIARVLARSDQASAERLLEQGIALAREIGGDATSLLMGNAISLAAAVSPKVALPLYAEYRSMDPFGGPVISLVNVLAGHGHIRDALEYLSDPLPGDRFPLHFVNNLAQECRDDETRRKLLELATREWRNPAPTSRSGRAICRNGVYDTFRALLETFAERLESCALDPGRPPPNCGGGECVRAE